MKINRTPEKSKIIIKNFVVAFGAATILILMLLAGAFKTWEWRLEDRLFVAGEPRGDIVIVAIDDASLQEIGRWPWDREVVADLVGRISSAGPKIIGLDVNFPEPAEGDEALADSLEQEFPIVLPIEAVLEVPAESKRRGPLRALETLGPVSQVAEPAELGLTNTPPDSDGIVRRIPVKVVDEDDNFIMSFSQKIANMVGEERVSPIIDEHNRMIINYQGSAGSYQSVPAKEIFNENFDAARLSGKIVLIGATALDLHDVWFTPTAKAEPMPGIELHANAVQTILDKNFLLPLSDLATVVIILFFALLLALSSLFLKTRLNIILPIILAAGYIAAATIVFDLGLIFNIFYPVAAIIIIFTSLTILRYVHESREKGQLKKAFEFYLSPHVIEEILKDPAKLSLGGVKKEMTVLFSDIRGFTTLSEGLNPEELTNLMNKYLTEMTNIVLAADGVLDKYIGDALMAFWGAPLPQPRHAERACSSALAMIKKLEKLNREKAWPEGREIKIGIGINTGEMVVGNMGAEKRFDYTILGDAVNLGSRVESINKQYGTKIIITEFTKSKISDEFVTRYLDKVAVKGKSEPVNIYELVCWRRDLELQQKEVIELYEEAFEFYQKKKWGRAMEMLKKISKLMPDDLATKNLIERCEYYKKEPPEKGWDGTWVMNTK